MDATKLLGALLGNNATGGSLAGKVLGGLLKGQGGGGSGAGNILGAILGGGQSQQQSSGAGGLLGSILGGGSPRQQQQPQGGGGILGSILGNAAQTHAQKQGHSAGIGDVLGGLLGGSKPEPIPEPPQEAQNAAEILIRAMTNAAKMDGQVDAEEQKNIVGRLGEISQEEVAFLQKELGSPLDLAGYCREVPSELAPQAYAFSLLAIKLDTNKEAQYLGQLAQGLGLQGEQCNAIHKQLGAPEIFS